MNTVVKMTRHTAIMALTWLWLAPAMVSAAGLNTNVALSPPQGGTIIRTQWRYTQLSGDPTPLGRETTINLQTVTVVHGLTANFTLLSTLPIVGREIDLAVGEDVSDTGIADITLLGKYRFHQHDEPGKTVRGSVIAGAQLPTFDSPFSSNSVDPIVGMVWTYQQPSWWVDWDVLYQFNTGGGFQGNDQLRADVAISYPLLGNWSVGNDAWSLYAIAEINTKYLTDGSMQVLASPGLQLISARWILELGIQLPIYQNMSSPRLETDFTTILSLRFQF